MTGKTFIAGRTAFRCLAPRKSARCAVNRIASCRAAAAHGALVIATLAACGAIDRRNERCRAETHGDPPSNYLADHDCGFVLWARNLFLQSHRRRRLFLGAS